ncbi:S8 family serine peptidase [Pseudomarimonas salicorniae]|uniref:S8 family serine peptidase n=1 Tax=Pseudomarimonas salicorniae TaxID=2933270 RepID=A0ABT0GMJ8_9GAMM|nr:S8 family serine peptidase [Lysobacter sp. CAU 1642]MCK7595592.1 S8 family serine peptidase [Lysobacter sp. CAU 1642]
MPLTIRPLRSALLLALGLATPCAALAGAKLSPTVTKAIAESGQADVLLKLAPAELPALSPAVGPAGQRQRTEQVVAALKAHAARSQAPLLAELDRLGIDARPLWLGNSIAARLDADQLAALREHPSLLRIDSDAARKVADLKREPASKSAAAVEPHLTAMRVPEAWALGARGRGVVVGGQDTGYQFDHPALRDRYRGSRDGGASHDYHWFDGVRATINGGQNPCGFASPTPCDDHMHGTHTMGTAIGDGGEGARIGVAIESQWIGCRNMDSGVGRPSTYLACFQFLLAPSRVDGSDARPDLAPAVTVNSWGCPPGPPPLGEDCSPDSFDGALAAADAAGQLTVVAAGNGQPFCGSIDDPPSTSPHALVVGATSNTGGIASFSLWGPVAGPNGPLLKPDISAPGVAIRSSLPGGGYGPASGTSMATPNVAGVAALMLGANPLLIAQPQATSDLLRGSAIASAFPGNCPGFPGSAVPNAVFGHGRVDALAAVNAATSLAVSPAHAGAWYDPARPGEGWILQINDAGTATLVWYSFSAEGSGKQAWYIAAEGAISGAGIRFDAVSAVRGGRFGTGFDANALRYDDVGSLNITFDGCDRASLTFSSTAGLPDLQRPLSRLTRLRGLPCGQPLAASSPEGAARSGAWFDPARSGEGWIIEALDAGAVALTWFTFDPSGAPAWLYGVGTLEGDALRIDDMRRVEGGGFGGDFDPAAVRDTAWGTLQIDFSGCDGASLRYAALDAAWGEGGYTLSRLTRPFGLDCAATAKAAASP